MMKNRIENLDLTGSKLTEKELVVTSGGAIGITDSLLIEILVSTLIF